MPIPDPSIPARLDRLADAAWPAEESEILGPWKLRAARGVTQRANSVLTTPPGPAVFHPADDRHIDRLIDLAERFYAQRGLPAHFHISPARFPPDLDDRLAARGYDIVSPAQVWTGDAAEVQRAIGALDSPVVLDAVPTDDWIACAFDNPLATRHVRAQIVGRIPGPAAFASIRDGDTIVAAALAVGADDWTGVFCMATRPTHRRRGHARALIRAIAARGLSGGRRRMYLQVMADNAPAQSLYRAAAFAFAYPFHFRRSPVTSEDGL